MLQSHFVLFLKLSSSIKLWCIFQEKVLICNTWSYLFSDFGWSLKFITLFCGNSFRELLRKIVVGTMSCSFKFIFLRVSLLLF